jgi:heptosyltransferase III
LKRILISRTDSLGDVILTLPLAGVLKKHFPGCRILFLGRRYTQPLISLCCFVDEFHDWDVIRSNPDLFPEADVVIHAFPVKEICRMAAKKKIPVRIATSHRWYSWRWCNKLVHYSRKGSDLHESQLSMKLLKPLGITEIPSVEEIPSFYAINIPKESSGENSGRKRVILHPKSKGSAREWGLDNFSALIRLLPADKFDIFITGTSEEGAQMKDFLALHHGRVTDMTGKMDLAGLIRFINSCDALVAASTGPLHIAAALGITAVGLYAPMRPIFPKRWAPLGEKAVTLVLDKECEKCRKTMDCECIRSIRPEEVARRLTIR